MTRALCFICGGTKFGAFNPCPQCGAGSTGNMNLDIAFSDHHLSTDTIEAFGAVIHAIRQVCESDELRFWSFLRFVSVHHPDILSINIPAEQQSQCDAILQAANPPAVVIPRAQEVEEG